MIGRADIEGSKSDVDMNSWPPQASYPCGNFSDTSSFKFQNSKGSLSHAFTVCIYTENQNQISFYPYVLHEISVLIELILGHLRYFLTDVPPQPNSPPDNVFKLGQKSRGHERKKKRFLNAFFLVVNRSNTADTACLATDDDCGPSWVSARRLAPFFHHTRKKKKRKENKKTNNECLF